MSTPPQFHMDGTTPPNTPNHNLNEKTPPRIRRIVDDEIHRMEKTH
jgi:hypothetical protein